MSDGVNDLMYSGYEEQDLVFIDSQVNGHACCKIGSKVECGIQHKVVDRAVSNAKFPGKLITVSHQEWLIFFCFEEYSHQLHIFLHSKTQIFLLMTKFPGIEIAKVNIRF